MMNSWFNKFKSNMPWLEDRTIFLARHGSHAYGTNIPSSDIDIRGVAIPPKEYLLGYLKHFEQAESKGDLDLVIFGFHKFIKLAAQCNPNIIEILWIDSNDWYSAKEPWLTLVKHRDLFLSQRAKHTFSGYAMSQLKRINTHYRWLRNPPKEKPERKNFGLPEKTIIPKDQLAAANAAVRKKVDTWELDLDALVPAQRVYLLNQITDYLGEIYGDHITEGKEAAAARTIGMDDNLIALLYQERNYTNAKREWDNYQNWKKNRNPVRAELEAKWGYDVKNAMHLVRLTKMCREIVTEGKVLVKRPDAEELLAIRNGAWKYEELVGWAEKEDKELTEALKYSPLPKKPNAERIDKLCVQITEEWL